jgi:hypothetical protein
VIERDILLSETSELYDLLPARHVLFDSDFVFNVPLHCEDVHNVKH